MYVWRYFLSRWKSPLYHLQCSVSSFQELSVLWVSRNNEPQSFLQLSVKIILLCLFCGTKWDIYSLVLVGTRYNIKSAISWMCETEQVIHRSLSIPEPSHCGSRLGCRLKTIHMSNLMQGRGERTQAVVHCPTFPHFQLKFQWKARLVVWAEICLALCSPAALMGNPFPAPVQPPCLWIQT